MMITFSGKGSTVFHLSDYNLTTSSYYRPAYTGSTSYGPNVIVGNRGAQVSFEGTAGGGYNYPGEDFNEIDSYNPCRAYILMDQDESGAVTNGQNKVVFKRNPGGYGESGDGLGIYHLDNPVGLHIDDASLMTYLSTDNTGLTGYGAMAFDVTHTGKGVMYLDIDQKNNSDAIRGGFNDGAIAIFGHYVPSWTASDIKSNVELNTIAGKKAIFRVIDNARYENTEIGTENLNPSDDYARGLMVINRNTTVPKFAADPYQENLLFAATNVTANHPMDTHHNTKYWAHYFAWKLNTAMLFNVSHNVDYNVQTGFVLGKNGRIDIAHKTFLDYVATFTTMKSDPYLAQDYSSIRVEDASTDLVTSSYLKKKNPAAFFVDGLYSSWNPNFEVAVDAEIFLYGDSKILLRAGSKMTDDSSTNGYVRSLYMENGDYLLTFTVDSGAYNGQYVPGANSDITSGEGRYVLDLEAPLDIKTFARGDLKCHAAYNPTTDTDDNGQLNLSTVSMDYTGREFNYVTNSSIIRALTKDTTYKIYDSPSVFLNSNLRLYDTVFNHSDITKLLTPNPSLALPNMVGGERKYFNDFMNPNSTPTPAVEADYIYPRFELFNSNLDMHEHFVGSGFRFVIHEIDDNDPAVSDNTSIFKFYDHGKTLDTLNHSYGRLLMATCSNNKMSDGSTNAILEHCDINVFRNYYKADPAQTIKLSLQSAYEPTLLLEPLLDNVHAHHLFLLNRGTYDSSHMSLGWTTTVGDKTKYPWQDLSNLRVNHFDIKVTTSGDPNQGRTKTPPATVSVDGNYVYFGGTDSSGNKATLPVTSLTAGSVVYVNHGGRITATQHSELTSGYDAFIDTPLVYQLWSYAGLYGIVDLPKDQVMFGYGFAQQPYNLDTVAVDSEEGSGKKIGTHLNVYNEQRVSGYAGRIDKDRFAGEEYVISWNNRIDDNIPVKDLDFMDYRTISGLDSSFANLTSDLTNKTFKTLPTKFTAIIDTPVTMPTNAIYFGAGENWADVVTQLKVAGATMADPLHLLIDGYASGPGYAWVKEVVAVPSTPIVYGEGDHGIIFLRNGGRVGLGNYSWNQHSINSWKLLGKDYLTISSAGNGSVDLNSDVFVVDRGAFVASTTFASTTEQRLTINLNGNDLYIPANGELDLSSFGETSYRQEIEFAGSGRVIFGHGSTVRFPALNEAVPVERYPVLYFNDETKLVIEDDPEVAKAKYTTIAAADADKVKIVGMGQIWINKNARFEVMGGAKVRFGSDVDSIYTNIRLSIRREGALLIGDEYQSGGSFEVGNPEAIANGAVNFELLLNGAKAIAHVDRGGFFGLGVGMIDNSSDNMNGDSTLVANPVVSTVGEVRFCPDTTNAWKVQTLFDANQIKITIIKGIFDHSNIFNGSDRLASLMAIGPIFVDEFIGLDASYTFDLPDPLKSRVFGGGNLFYLDKSTETAPVETYPISAYVNAWDFADLMLRQERIPNDSEDYGMYSISASDPVMTQWFNSDFANSTITNYTNGGKKFVSGANVALDLFTYLAFRSYDELRTKLIDCGATQYDVYVGYVNTPRQTSSYTYAVNAKEIYRRTNINLVGEGFAEEGLVRGVLGATGRDDVFLINVAGRR